MRTDFRQEKSMHPSVRDAAMPVYTDLQALRRQQQLKKLLEEVAALTPASFRGDTKGKA